MPKTLPCGTPDTTVTSLLARTEGREVSYGKIGPTTVAVTQDLLSGMPLVLKIERIRLWNSILPEPGQHSAQLSKLIGLTACKKAMHAISRWYRTVYIPWLVASYAQEQMLAEF